MSDRPAESAPSAEAGPAPESASIAGAASAPASAAPAPPAADEAQTVTIDELAKIDLRVAVVLAAERVPKTAKLIKLQLDLGTEERTIVSGIAEFYEPEALVGRRIVIVANLKPARIRGVESRGMLLAAGGRGPGEAFGLISLDNDIPPGTRVS